MADQNNTVGSLPSIDLAALTDSKPGIHVFAERNGMRFYIRSFHGPIPIEEFQGEYRRLSKTYPGVAFMTTTNVTSLVVNGQETDLKRECEKATAK